MGDSEGMTSRSIASAPEAIGPSRANDQLSRLLLLDLQLIFVLWLVADPLLNRLAWPTVSIGLLLVVPGLLIPVALARQPAATIWGWLLLLFLGITGAFQIQQDIQPSDFFRGVVPYVIYLGWFAAALLLSAEQTRRLVRTYVAVAVLLALKTFVILIQNQVGFADFQRGVRATYYDLNSSLVLSACAIPLVLGFVRSTQVRLVLVLVLGAQVLVSMSKSLIGLTLVALPAYFVAANWRSIRRSPRRLLTHAAALVLGAALVFSAVRTSPFFSRFHLAVLSPDTELSGRATEVRNALAVFRQAPFTGAGVGLVFRHVGTPAPGAISVQERRYTHSALFYHLAAVGLLGTVLYMGMILHPILRALSRWSWAGGSGLSGPEALAVVLATGVVLSMLFVTAGFKNPQTNMLLGFLNAVLVRHLSRPGRCAQAPA